MNERVLEKQICGCPTAVDPMMMMMMMMMMIIRVTCDKNINIEYNFIY